MSKSKPEDAKPAASRPRALRTPPGWRQRETALLDNGAKEMIEAAERRLDDLTPRWEMEALMVIADKLRDCTLSSVRKPRAACIAIARAAMAEAKRIR